MPSRKRLIAILVVGVVVIGLAVWARGTWGPDRYRGHTRSQLEAVLARRPNDAVALHQLGLRTMKERRFTEARRILERALAAAPGRVAIVQALGEACAHQQDFGAARHYFEQVVQMEPSSAGAYRSLGDMRGVAGDYVGAVEAYQRALALEPKDVGTLVSLGSAYADAMNPGKAMASFQQALALDPKSAEAYQGLGRACLRLRRYREAREALRQAAALDPNDAHTAAFLGLAYAEQIQGPADAEEAIRQLDRAVSLGYQAAEAEYGRGLVHLYRKEYGPAIASLRAATRRDPGAENMAYQLARAYLAAGRTQEGQTAMARFQRLQRTRPELRRLRQQVQARPDDITPRRRLARLCLDTGRASEALRHFLVLARRQPGDSEVLKGLAAAAAAAGNPAVAAQARAALANVMAPGTPVRRATSKQP